MGDNEHRLSMIKNQKELKLSETSQSIDACYSVCWWAIWGQSSLQFTATSTLRMDWYIWYTGFASGQSWRQVGKTGGIWWYSIKVSLKEFHMTCMKENWGHFPLERKTILWQIRDDNLFQLLLNILPSQELLGCENDKWEFQMQFSNSFLLTLFMYLVLKLYIIFLTILNLFLFHFQLKLLKNATWRWQWAHSVTLVYFT